MTDRSAQGRKGKAKSPWGWYPHVPRRKNFERNHEYKKQRREEGKDEPQAES